MNYIIIDVREPSEYQSGHVTGAINIPPSELMNNPAQLNTIPKDAAIIVYCLSGSRSTVSINILKGLGYTELINGINQQHVEAKYGV